MAVNDPKNDNRKVRFSDEPQVKEVVTVENDEREAVWYTRQDLQSIRQQGSEAAATEAVAQCDDASLCFKFDHQRQKDFVSALLKQQMEHRQMGMHDPKGLFQLSKAFSKKSRQEALQVARVHEKEVKTYQSEKERTMGIIDDALALLSIDVY